MFFTSFKTATQTGSASLGLLLCRLTACTSSFFVTLIQKILLLSLVVILLQYLLPLFGSHRLWSLILRLLVLVGIKVICCLHKCLGGSLRAEFRRHLLNIFKLLADTAHVNGQHHFVIRQLFGESQLLNISIRHGLTFL